MTAGAVSYANAAVKLRQMSERAPGTVSVATRVPADVAEAIEAFASENDVNKSMVIRQALIQFLESLANQQVAPEVAAK